MADELKISTSLTYNPPGISEGFSGSLAADIATGRVTKAVQVVGTTEESFALVDVASVRYFLVQNLDATNFVQVGVATGAYAGKLLPGDFMIFPPNANALFLKADTAACAVLVLAVNA